MQPDASSSRWSTASEYSNGKWHQNTLWPGWCSGDELVFKLDLAEDKGLLSVWSTTRQQRHQIKLASHDKRPYIFQFAVTQDGAMRLHPSSVQDQQLFVQRWYTLCVFVSLYF